MLKGEIVVLIGKGLSSSVSKMDLESKLEAAMQTMSVRDAADKLSVELGIKRRQVYQLALKSGADETEALKQVVRSLVVEFKQDI